MGRMRKFVSSVFRALNSDFQCISMASKRMDLVRSLSKSVTFRLGVRDYRLGEAVLIDSYDGSFIDISIVGIKLVKLESINLADLTNSGYDSIQDFHDEMIKIYPNIKPLADVTVVNFIVRNNGKYRSISAKTASY